MGKKKGKKGKKAKALGTEILTEVDKTFYELQITDLNRKLARLRTYSTDLEEKVNILETGQGKTEADRADVICYLKRTLTEKNTEALELQDRVVALEVAQDSNEEAHQEEIAAMKVEFESMREQLLSDIKLITGKLNALEEFRFQRDDLMAKFTAQENQIEEQELRHKRAMYEVERKFILGKDAVKREMEQQLFQLAKDFESANELRIAATTQRVIRENIVINNELNKLIYTSEEFQKENTALKAKIKDFSSFNSALETERNKALKDFSIQKAIIHQMVGEINRQKDIAASQECDIERGKIVERDLKKLKIHEGILNNKIKAYEQEMHSVRCNEQRHKINIHKFQKHISVLRGIIFETLYSVETLMNLEGSDDVKQREELFQNVLLTLRKVCHDIPAIDSETTMLSTSKLYLQGDIGLVQRVVLQTKPRPMRLNAESQMGPSFHDFVAVFKDTPDEVEEIKPAEVSEDDYHDISESSEQSVISALSEESDVSSKKSDKVLVSHIEISEVVEAEVEEEEEEEEDEEDGEEEVDTVGSSTVD